MLRRKLATISVTIVVLLLLAAVGAVWMFQAALQVFPTVETAADHEAFAARFRWLVFGLSALFLILLNIYVVALLRMGTLVVRPVEALLVGTRELARERYDYRIAIDSHDEFGELAAAFNSLAEQLQRNEQRKLEVLGQVGTTLNHELNNAIAIIELQLQMLSRKSGGDANMEKYARQIHEGLARMTKTVGALKQVRRIVLTDYVAGVKMIDLERSMEEEKVVETGEPQVHA